jgi:hypothetical protein
MNLKLKSKQLSYYYYRESVTRFFASAFFHESSSPKHLKITLGSFQIFSRICEDIRKSRCTTSINDIFSHRYTAGRKRRVKERKRGGRRKGGWKKRSQKKGVKEGRESGRRKGEWKKDRRVEE